MPRLLSSIPPVAILLFLTTLAHAQSPTALRYLAEWCDGSRSSAAEIADWSWVDKQPRMLDRPLYDPGNRIRWLRDTTLEAPLPSPAVIEFIGGDMLPGKVVGYRSSVALPDSPVPSHLLVEPSVSLDRPGTAPRPLLRIVPQWVRRVIWERRPHDRFSPGTVFCRDGRQMHYRSLRWHESSVRLLMTDGTQQLAFEEIAELHLPPADDWESLASQRVCLSPTAASLLMTIESIFGLKATTSLERFEARSIGKEGEPNNWLHAFQPSWSLDGLYVYHRQIRHRQFFAAHEVPLTAITPVRMAHRAAFAAGWKNARTNQSVFGGPLIGAGEPFAWGYGVHAHHELEFDLSPAARTFRTRLALDPSVGGGGCVRVMVYHGSTEGEPLYESPPLVGSQKVIDTGRMALAPTIQGRSRLICVADALIDDAPAGSDPLDIRDALNWLEPMIELNPDEAYKSITARWLEALPALAGWKVDRPYLDDWRIQHTSYATSFAPVVNIGGTRWQLQRKFAIDSNQSALAIRVSHPDRRSTSGLLRVLVDGQKVHEGPIPVTVDPASVKPLTLPLNAEPGREVEVTLQFELNGASMTLDWRGAAIVSLMP